MRKKSKRERIQDRINMPENERKLFELCYKYEDLIKWEQYEKYQYRIFRKDVQRSLDVWPISRRYYRQGMNGSKVYKDVKELLEPLGIK